MNHKLLKPVPMFCVGLVLGILSRVFDLTTQNLGNVFSQLAIWILLGTLIAIYSHSKKQAMGNILPFCLGMLLTYYATAMLTNGVYSKTFLLGWTVFALLSPIFAYFTWMAKEKGLFPCIIRIGIIAVSVFSSVVLFDGFRIYDCIIDLALVYLLFFKQVRR